MEAGNWKSYQDYYERSSFFDREKEIDDELAYIERKQEEFLDAVVEKKLGIEIEDKAEEYISDYQDFNDSIETMVDAFECYIEQYGVN